MGKTETATKTACEIFNEEATKLKEFEARFERSKNKMSAVTRDKFAKQLARLQRKVGDALLACVDKDFNDTKKDKIDKKIQDLVNESIGGLRDGFVEAASNFSTFVRSMNVQDQKVSNAGFVNVVPNAAVQAAAATFSERSLARDLFANIAAGPKSPIANSLDPKSTSVEKTLSTLTANMAELSQKVFDAFNNFGVKLRTKNPNVWTTIAFNWIQGGREPSDEFYASTGIPRPIKFGHKITIAMRAALAEWVRDGQQRGPALQLKKETIESRDLPDELNRHGYRELSDELKRQMHSRKDNINVEIDRSVYQNINPIRIDMDNAGEIFESWVKQLPPATLSFSGTVSDLGFAGLSAVVAAVGSLFPPATVALTIANSVFSGYAKRALAGVDPKDALAMATIMKTKLAVASTELGEKFEGFGESLFKLDSSVWYQIAFAYSVPRPAHNPKDPSFKPSDKDEGMPKVAQHLLHDKAGVPRAKKGNTKVLLKTLIETYLKWEKRTGNKSHPFESEAEWEAEDQFRKYKESTKYKKDESETDKAAL
jgi:hypothetical protein